MGEVVDLSGFGEIDESSKMEITPAAIENAAELLRSGKKRETIKTLFRNKGFSFSDSEKIVTRAEALLYAPPKKKVNFPKLFVFGVAGLLALAVLAFGILSLSSGADCGEDTFCVQKKIDCVPGSYRSSYRGMSYEYEISGAGAYCQVFTKCTASNNPDIYLGMSMNCLYPLSGGKSGLSSGECTGSLAVPLGL